MWNAELRGSAGGAKAPHRVDPRNGILELECVHIHIKMAYNAILAQVWCPPPKSEKGSTIRVG